MTTLIGTYLTQGSIIGQKDSRSSVIFGTQFISFKILNHAYLKVCLFFFEFLQPQIIVNNSVTEISTYNNYFNQPQNKSEILTNELFQDCLK